MTGFGNRGLVIQAALLVGALFIAYQTWTRDTSVKLNRGDVVVWNGSGDDVQSVVYTTDRKTVRVERRKDAAGDYLWGTVTRTTTVPARPAPPTAPVPPGAPGAPPHGTPGAPPHGAPPHGAPGAPPHGAPGDQHNDGIPADSAAGAGAPAEPAADRVDSAEPAADRIDSAEPGDEPPGQPAVKPEPETKTTTVEFPVGEAGEQLFEDLGGLKALRDLGKLDPEELGDYGLADSKDELAIQLGDRTRTLIVGARVYSSNDRYVMDSDSGVSYVLSGDIMRPLDGAESSLRIRDLHRFTLADIDRVTVSSASGERVLVKTKEDPKPDSKTEPKDAWANADTPTKPDQTLANFLDRVDKLSGIEFFPDLSDEGMTVLLTVTYYEGNKQRGQTVLLEQPGDSPATNEYYVRSEETRVLAKVNRMTADRIEKDVQELFAPPGESPEPDVPDLAPER